MKLNLYDNVKLNKEVDELGERGIHKGCKGTIAKLGAEKSLIVFYNPKDIGDYAFAWVENTDLDFFGKMDETLIKEFAERIAKLNPAKKLCFEDANLQEYDTVELVVEKAAYAKHGAHKGMIGTILDPEKIAGGWLVYFPDETGADTIGITVKEKDLKLVHRPE